MVYFAIRDDSGEVTSVGISYTDAQADEITEAEYNVYLKQFETLNQCVENVFDGSMSINDVPEEIRGRVGVEVEKLKESANQPRPLDDIEEALAILSGEVTE